MTAAKAAITAVVDDFVARCAAVITATQAVTSNAAAVSATPNQMPLLSPTLSTSSPVVPPGTGV